MDTIKTTPRVQEALKKLRKEMNEAIEKKGLNYKFYTKRSIGGVKISKVEFSETVGEYRDKCFAIVKEKNNNGEWTPEERVQFMNIFTLETQKIYYNK